MQNKRNVRIAFLILSAFFVALSVFWMLNAFNKIRKSFSDRLEDGVTMNSDYASLFRDGVLKGDVTVQAIKRSKYRNDIAILNVDSAYTLIIYEISKNDSVLRLPKVNYTPENGKRTVDIVYRGIKTPSIEFDYVNEINNSKLEELYFYANADSVDIKTQDDSTIYYRLNIRSAAVCYEKEGVKDLYIESTENVQNPTEILFMNRNGKVYVVLLSANFRNLYLPKRKILSLVK